MNSISLYLSASNSLPILAHQIDTRRHPTFIPKTQRDSIGITVALSVNAISITQLPVCIPLTLTHAVYIYSFLSRVCRLFSDETRTMPINYKIIGIMNKYGYSRTMSTLIRRHIDFIGIYCWTASNYAAS